VALRYGFLGSPPFATDVLAALVAAGRVPLVVVTQPPRPVGRSSGSGRAEPPSPVVELAERHGVPVLRPESSKDAALREHLRALELDVLLVASYGELLDEAFLALPKRFCLNVHGSLLPRWRGASPVQAALAAGDNVTGVSIQRVVKKLDAGDVMLALETPIGARETGGELFARLAHLGGEAAVHALALVEAGQESFVPQDVARVTHCKKLTKESGAIDWSRPAADIERLVRAMDPWPGASTTLPSGERFLVWSAEVAPAALAPTTPAAPANTDRPGRARVHAGAIDVATGDGTLRLVEVQAPGKKRLATADFLRGARLPEPLVFGGFAAPTEPH
jgi:methionyl-tRNA formyltransferase